ncbi:MAG: glycoside hydrolase family 31 protein [Bacteroidota bacterium]|nr:glycoside hydrolase family 31 protein [Bacteroidota bacterium]
MDRIYKKILLAVGFLSATQLVSFAQGYQKTNSGLKVTMGNMNIELQFYGPEIVRVLKYPAGAPFEKNSLSVIATPQQISTVIKGRKEVLTVRTSKLLISLDTVSGDIDFSNLKGDMLLKEKQNGAQLTPFNDAGNKTYSVTQAFVLDKEEPIYGLGQHQRGDLNLRNVHFDDMIQGNTEDVVPFFQSIKGYGVFWDNYSPTSFIDRPEETILRSTVGDGIDYYFMYGGNADGVIAAMRYLTGQAPLFPLWTFGYWQSKERYKSQAELVDVVRKYRELKVPLDGIIQDWQYWGDNYLWNAMDFLNPEYPHPQKMVDDIHGLHAHMIISIWASFGPMTRQYHELKQKGMLLDFLTWPESGSQLWPPRLDYPSGVRPYDPYNPEARDIYWRYASKGLFSIGIDGWWMDSSEPDHLDAKPSDLDLKTYLGSFRKVRNAFPLMTVGGVSQHQRAETSAKRVFILTRSAFAGQQRYGANTWSGDITSSWETLSKQIPTGLDFSLSGIPYWNSDIGGFFLGKYRRKLEDPDYRELYARWIEFGTFCPMMRSHGTDAPREIYQFGKEGTRTYDAIAKFIRLRYRLLPYIYGISRDVTAHQSSMMRALMMDFGADKDVWNVNDEYMFGKALLVSPVVSPMYTKSTTNDSGVAVKVEDYSKVKTKTVYLPKGANWYDFWSGEKFSGGQKIDKQAPLDVIPLYVKAGSILPFGPDVQYATEKKWDDLEIRIYPGADADYTLYEDENDNYNYEQGKFSEIKFHWDDKARSLKIGERAGSFPGMLDHRRFRITIAPKYDNGSEVSDKYRSVSYDGKVVAVTF